MEGVVKTTATTSTPTYKVSTTAVKNYSGLAAAIAAVQAAASQGQSVSIVRL